MRMVEFILEAGEPIGGYEAVLTTVLERPVAVVASFADAPTEGVWATVMTLATGDFRCHIQLFRVPDDAIEQVDAFYAALASTVESALLVADDESDNPYAFRVWHDNEWSSQAVVPDRLDDDGIYILSAPSSAVTTDTLAAAEEE